MAYTRDDCNYVIEAGSDLSNLPTFNPGDIVGLAGGEYSTLFNVRHLRGQPDAPIIFANLGEVVLSRDSGDHVFHGCQHFNPLLNNHPRGVNFSTRLLIGDRPGTSDQTVGVSLYGGHWPNPLSGTGPLKLNPRPGHVMRDILIDGASGYCQAYLGRSGNDTDHQRVMIENIEVRNLKIYGGSEGIQVKGCRDAWVHHNEINDVRSANNPNAEGGIFVNRWSTTARVEHNIVRDSEGMGVFVAQGEGGVRIAGNLLVNCGYADPQYTDAIRTRRPAEIVHNTIHEAHRYGAKVWSGVPTGHVANNAILDSGRGAIQRGGLPASSVHHNLTDASPEDVFVDWANGDYRLRPGSPAIGAGVAGLAQTDLGGCPYADPPSIGCYEFPEREPPPEVRWWAVEWPSGLLTMQSETEPTVGEME